MKRKKMMAAVLAALMTCSAFTPAVAVKADDDVVKLKIWVFGEGSTEECEKVSEALSEITREKIGAEVEIYQTIDTEKLNLAMTSGEKLDLVCAKKNIPKHCTSMTRCISFQAMGTKQELQVS